MNGVEWPFQHHRSYRAILPTRNMNDEMMKHPLELSRDPDSNQWPLVHMASMLPLTHAGRLTKWYNGPCKVWLLHFTTTLSLIFQNHLPVNIFYDCCYITTCIICPPTRWLYPDLGAVLYSWGCCMCKFSLNMSSFYEALVVLLLQAKK